MIDEKDVADLPTTTSFAGLGGISNDTKVWLPALPASAMTTRVCLSISWGPAPSIHAVSR